MKQFLTDDEMDRHSTPNRSPSSTAPRRFLSDEAMAGSTPLSSSTNASSVVLSDADMEGSEPVSAPNLTTPHRASTPRTLSDAEMDAMSSAAETPGMLQSFARGAGTGATFGFDDELGLQDKSAREVARKANPWTFFAGEVAGGAIPVVAATLAGPIAAPAAAAAKGASWLARSGRAVLGALAPTRTTSVGNAAWQGLKVGGTHGAFHGAGNADPSEDKSTSEALIERAKGAGSGALLSGAGGMVLGPVAHGVSKVAQNVWGARAASRLETDDPSQGALLAISRGLERDRVDPADLIKQIRGEMADTTATRGANRYWGSSSDRQPWTDDMVEEVARRVALGENATQISAALRSNGTGPGARSVSTLLEEMEHRSVGPLNLVDRASLVRTGSGDNTQMTMRAAAATPGEARSVAREALHERQIGASSRLGEAFDRLIGSSDYDGVAAKHTQALKDAGDKAYTAARASQKPFNLKPVVYKWDAATANRKGPVPEEIQAAIKSINAPMPWAGLSKGGRITQRMRLPTDIDDFINARQNITAAIEAAKQKYGADGAVTRALTQFRRELSDEVARTNPAWKAANDIWRDGKAAQDAMEAGARMSTRLNTRTRESMEEFLDAKRAYVKAARAGDADSMAAAQSQMDLFRIGLARALSDRLKNSNATNDLTRTLRLPAAREMLSEVLGKKEAAHLLRVVDAEHAMHRTYASQFGSQTTPLKEAVDDLNWAPRMSSVLDLARPGKWLDLTGDLLARNYNAGRNSKMMPILTEENPFKQLGALRGINQITRSRSSADKWAGSVPRGAIGPLVGAGTGENAANWREEEQRRKVVRGMIGPIR